MLRELARPFAPIIAGLLGVIGVTIFAVDSSYDRLNLDEAIRLKNEHGVQLYIQALSALPSHGLEHPPHRVESLQNAGRADLMTAGYALLGPYWWTGMTPAQQMDFAREGIPDDVWDALEFVAVDVEVEGVRLNDVRAACDRLAWWGKKPCVIYTSFGAWHDIGNPMRDEGWRLWNAYWDNESDIDFTGLPFGGWQPEEILCEQYSGGSFVGSQFVDKNTCVWTSTPSPQPVPEPPSWPEWDGERWHMEDGWSYDPGPSWIEWYSPDGRAVWGECKSWGGRWNLLTGHHHPQGTRLHHPEIGWYEIPACRT